MKKCNEFGGFTLHILRLLVNQVGQIGVCLVRLFEAGQTRLISIVCLSCVFEKTATVQSRLWQSL